MITTHAARAKSNPQQLPDGGSSDEENESESA
jgi:hypothetical protein